MCSGVPFVGVGMMPEQDLNIRLAVNKGRRAARGTHFIADIAPFFCTLLLPHTCGKPLAWGILGALAFGAARFLLWLKHICWCILWRKDCWIILRWNAGTSGCHHRVCPGVCIKSAEVWPSRLWSLILHRRLLAWCTILLTHRRCASQLPKSERNARSIQGNTPLLSWSSRNLLENEQQSWHLTRR